MTSEAFPGHMERIGYAHLVAFFLPMKGRITQLKTERAMGSSPFIKQHGMFRKPVNGMDILETWDGHFH